MHYEADPAKAATNVTKHDVTFDEAATCLIDPVALAMEGASEGEPRWVLMGSSARVRIDGGVHDAR